MTAVLPAAVRLTQLAKGGGCACKIPPGALEDVVQRAAAARLARPAGRASTTATTPPWSASTTARAVVATADFFTPVVDDAYDWGRIAAANALSDVYAMGGRPVVALNLVGWPMDVLPIELLAEVLRGGADIGREAGCHVAGGHSIDDPEPKYGMAVTGLVDPQRLLRNDAAQAGLPLSLSKPLGVGVLNNRHKSTGEVFAHADRQHGAAQPRRRAGRRRRGRPRRHRRHRLRAARPPAQDDARQRGHRGRRQRRRALPRRRPRRAARRLRQRRHPPQPRLGPPAPVVGASSEDELLLLADAQTSGGLLVVGEVPGCPVVGEVVARREHAVEVR